MIENISAVMIASNAEETLERSLRALESFREVIVYENNSSDDTAEIARNFPNVTLIQGEFLGFGPTKNKAASYATNEWIFSLDSDEILSKALVEELASLELSQQNCVYTVRRKNYFLDKEVRFSGWGSERLVRLYNKSRHRFNDNAVHEKIAVDETTLLRPLQSPLIHLAVTDINRFLDRIARYSDLAAAGKKTCCYFIVVAKACFAFFRTYIIQLGILDGWRGFFIAHANFTGKLYRYTKRYLNCKR